MITVINAYLFVQGDNYSPRKIEEASGLIFSEKEEVGDLGKRGKYKDKPVPYGAAFFNFKKEDTILYKDGSDLLNPHSHDLKKIIDNIDIIKQDAECLFIHFGLSYDAQCNFEISSTLITNFSKLGIDVTFSCINEN